MFVIILALHVQVQLLAQPAIRQHIIENQL